MISKKKCCVIFVIAAFFSTVMPQQKISISGIIVDSYNSPVENANILIEGTGLGTSSDKEGKFVLQNLSEGKYVLMISSVGYENNRTEINLSIKTNIELKIYLEKKNIKIDNVVVTGTRTNKNLLETPVRTEIVSKSAIQHSALTRLDDVLFEQPGLALIDEPWGKGLQMQGLDPAYTLILIDGEPLIGRAAGTIDLSRFSVSNLKQIEIVKGPSSSLYGSEALAGVINLITEMPDVPYDLNLQSIYKTNNTIDVLGKALIKINNLTTSLFFDRLSSDGYDLNNNSLSLTAPKFHNYTIVPHISYRFNDSSILKLNSRIFLEEQKNTLELITNDQTEIINETGKLTDWNNSLIYEHKFSSQIKSEVKLYISGYFTDSKLTFRNDGSIYDHSSFDQYLYKGEIKNDLLLNDKNYIVAGGGYFRESVEADRIYNGKKIASSYYIFAQEEWIPNETFDFVLGTRFDWHSEYASKLSPKISVLIKPFGFLKIRASFGTGFKAPTLQQLYLDFTNSQAGYSVFGSSNIKNSFQRLQHEGQISKILIDPSDIGVIRAENSIAFNLSFDITPWKFLNASVNLFRNNVKDLIEATPIAVKTNGQSVFTYFNLNKIYTQGIESEIKIYPVEDISFAVSYQYLESVDEEVLDQIRAGEISKQGSNGRIRPVQESEYGGLYNRSKHSGTIKFDYQNKNFDLTANLRGVFRGKYGFGDSNGNGILDDKSEYVPGYAVWNFTITKQAATHFTFLFGVENILDKTNSDFIPSLPGRIIYGGIQYSMF